MKRAFTICLLLFAVTARGQGMAELEAAFLYQFSLFTQFADESEALTVQIHDRPDLLLAMQTLAARKKWHGKEIRVSGGGNGTKAHMVFLSAPTDADLEVLVKQYEGCKCLIVTSREGFGRRGAVVNFYQEGDRLRFEINRGTSDKHQLKLSSQILRLARIVE